MAITDILPWVIICLAFVVLKLMSMWYDTSTNSS